MTATAAPVKTVQGVTLRLDPAREPCFTVVHTDAEMADWPGMSDQSRRGAVAPSHEQRGGRAGDRGAVPGRLPRNAVGPPDAAGAPVG
jgi:hypothetical protein